MANVPETMDPDSKSDDSGGGSSSIMQYTRKYVGGAVMQARQPVAKQFMQFLDTHLSPTPPPERQVGTNPASLLSPSSATVEATAAADPVKLGIHEPPKPSDGLASRGYSVEMYQPGGRGE